MDQSFRFLELPAELRHRVYELLFFGADDHGRIIQLVYRDLHKPDLYFEDKGIISSIALQPSEYHTHRCRAISQRPFNLAIFRTCHAIYEEAESVFYASASFDLRGLWRTGGCHEFLQSFPRRIRKLIRRVELYCYDKSLSPRGGPEFLGVTQYSRKYKDFPRVPSLFDWTIFTTFLARECPCLHSLKLWVAVEALGPVSLVHEQSWIESLLQIRGLRYFDMPVKACNNFNSRQGQMLAGAHHLLPWLRSSLLSQRSKLHQELPASVILRTARPFNLLALPVGLRARIFSYALLPANKRLYPYIKAWYRPVTRNIIPLFSTCKLIRQEAEDVVYGQAIFCVSDHYKYAWMLLHFFENIELRLRVKVGRIMMQNCSPLSWGWLPRYLIRYIHLELTLKELICTFQDDGVERLNNEWSRAKRKIFGKVWRALFRSCQRVDLTVVGKAEITPALRHWIQHELGEQNTQVKRRRQTLRSSHVAPA